MASQRLPYPASTEPIQRTVRVSPSAVRQPKGKSDLLNVLRPRLPSASELLPYLEEIDQRRWYSNSGPLVTRLEEQLSRHLFLGSRRHHYRQRDPGAYGGAPGPKSSGRFHLPSAVMDLCSYSSCSASGWINSIVPRCRSPDLGVESRPSGRNVEAHATPREFADRRVAVWRADRRQGLGALR